LNEKQFVVIVVTFSGIIKVLKLLQLAKQLLPKLVTVVGISIFVKLLHPLNISKGILLIDD
jgi:hypothetical protein